MTLNASIQLFKTYAKTTYLVGAQGFHWYQLNVKGSTSLLFDA